MQKSIERENGSMLGIISKMSVVYRKDILSWVTSLRKNGISQLAQQLEEDNGNKSEILERIEKAGLPICPRKIMRLGKLLKDHRSVLKRFKFSLYWLSLLPLNHDLPKITRLGLTGKEVVSFLSKYKEFSDNYNVLVSEYEKDEYGGSIISNEEVVYVELAKGDQINISQGLINESELYVAKKERLNTSFSYTTDIKVIREIIYKALQYIRRKDYQPERETDIRFMEGYFEFSVTDSSKEISPKITFFDYKTSPSFIKFPNWLPGQDSNLE